MLNKSKKRVKILNDIIHVLKHPDIYGTIDYIKQDESRIKQFIYPHLLRKIENMFIEFDGIKESTAKNKAQKSLIWEGDKKSTVHNLLFFNVFHRPDMIVEFKDLNIAIEIKKGDNGSSIREGIGQCMIYSKSFDFTIFLMIDTNKDKRIVNSLQSDKEKTFIKDLWESNNIMFNVV